VDRTGSVRGDRDKGVALKRRRTALPPLQKCCASSLCSGGVHVTDNVNERDMRYLRHYGAAFGASDATILSKRGSPRRGSQ
jgi:hypothetical protein